ncbi:hypothetical protein GQ53DRAFT_497293 [Thozetella sp. PMI_491]|nr:hypothetical protein GQ53DRAFT_497293 [Thozetella sp. PMI_491]
MRAVVVGFAAGWLLAGGAAGLERFGVMPEPTLAPRSYLAASPLRPLARRESVCDSGSHPCDDIGTPGVGVCCKDTSYCIVDPTNDAKASCCALGSKCGSPCEPDTYKCNATTTTTSGASTITSLYAACCNRVCGATKFQCPSSLGGGCCDFGQGCGDHVCLKTSTPTPSAVVTQLPAGCTTSQIGCPSSLGGGCCANTQVCTMVTGAALCAPATVVPTESGVTAAVQSSELSTGAKAGIGVGVVVASAVVIGLATWCCIRQRRLRRSQAAASQRQSVPQIVGGGGRAMTETNSDTMSRGGPLAGMNQDYFGPNAGVGPYTDNAQTEVTSPGTSPGIDRAVPLEPHGPGDIAAAVEIDSRASPGPRGPDDHLSQGTRSNQSSVVHSQPVSNTIDGRFELYGDDPAAVAYIPSPDTETPHMQTPPEHPMGHTPQSVQTPQTEEVYATPLGIPGYHNQTGSPS